MSSPRKNLAILAAAGSRKTELIVESALSIKHDRVLVTTYTNENRREIVRRIEQKVGTVPANVTVLGWFSFLIAHWAKPYQRALTDDPLRIRGLNFKGRRNRFTPKDDPNRYFLDANGDLFRDGVSDFAVQLNAKTGGRVLNRVNRLFPHIFVDEVQDLAGYDLDVLDLLLRSQSRVTLVGDPRQHTLSTNIGSRNKKYRGAGLKAWFEEREDICVLESRSESYRCNQAICDFADALYPAMPATTSVGVPSTNHDGIFFVDPDEIDEYMLANGPVTALRHDRTVDTAGHAARNIGVAKGGTFDRVLIFPTRPMLTYLKDGDPSKLKAPEKLYVAATRARFSVAFVVKASRDDR